MRLFAHRRHLLYLLLCLPLFLTAAPIDWERAESLDRGIKLAKLNRSSPLQRVYVVRVDLQTPELTFTATQRDSAYGKAMPIHRDKKRRAGVIRTKRITTVNFMQQARALFKNGGRELDMVLAVNAAPWTPWPPPEHPYADPIGTNITDGKIITDHPTHAAFVIYKNGVPAILDKLEKKDFRNIHLAVSGFDVIMLNGKPTDRAKEHKGRDPRMAYGLSADKRYFFIIAVDGRQPKWSIGASYSELCGFFRDAGASDAINMDGGGSTSLVYFNKKTGQPVFVNHHANKAQRKVGSNLGIFRRSNRSKHPPKR